VTKDDVKVAVLTFTKSAYRLGETVLGVVEINERGGRGKVISVSGLFLILRFLHLPFLKVCIDLSFSILLLTHLTAKRNVRNE